MIDLNSNLTKKRQLIRNNEYYDMQLTYDRLFADSKNGKKFTNLIDIISDDSNIMLAYRNIRRNQGSKTPGIDKKTIKYFDDMDTTKYINLIKGKLANYNPKPIRRVEIPKDNGSTRKLGIPCMVDRLVQQCIKQVLEPICEAKFHKHSYGFRPNRSAHHALARLNFLINRGKMHYAVDIDIKGFFDNVNHGKLLKQIWSMGIRDKNLISIISKMLKSEIVGIGTPTKGTPQGGILSPLLSNIVLNELDWWISNQWETMNGLKHEYSCFRSRYQALHTTGLKKMFIVRYADDFKIVCADYKSAQKIFIATKDWLKNRLGLEISPNKSKVTNLRKNNTEFLGFKIKAKLKGNKYIAHTNMSEKSKRKVIEKIKKQIKVIFNKNDRNEVNRYNAIVCGEHQYYKYATNINHNMSDINYYVSRYRYNKLRLSWKREYKMTEGYERLYGDYKSKMFSIKGIILFPIYGCTTKPPICFKQEICNYTHKGRKFIHEYLKGYGHTLRRLMVSQIGSDEESLKYYDNRIAKLIEQNGRDYISGKGLVYDNMECHHIIPKDMGGTNDYKNLVWISSESHKLIHCTQAETIHKYLAQSKLTKKALNKVNTLRKKAGNLTI